MRAQRDVNVLDLAKKSTIQSSMILERNIPVPMRDGLRLLANLFRPPANGPWPVILSVTPYSKDKLPDRLKSFFMRLSGVKFGNLNCSRWAGFESPDPAYWVENGYAVVQADVRGMHKSEGQAGVLRPLDAQDYYDLIEWAAVQPWCTGRIGLMGVSYLAMSQWHVAALKPPHLRAIVPWEGVTDLYRELAFHGGIPETKFVPTWFKNRIKRGRNRRFPLAEDFLVERERHPLDDSYWSSKRPILEDIVVPALVCASWSDHGLHTRGSIEGFERISSREKWLFTHGRKKWETFYSDEALAFQKRFLDCFLRDVDTSMTQDPRVRLEIRRSFYQHDVRQEENWPIKSVQPARLYLCASTSGLQREPVEEESRVQYRSTGTKQNDRASFSFRFDETTELTGGMRLKLFVSTSEGDDLDLFVVIRKFDSAKREVFFSGYNGYERDAAAKGWLRASHRELDQSRSTPLRPWLRHTRVQKLRPNETVPSEIEIWPSSTLFESGSMLQVVIQGHDAAKYPAFGHHKLVNRGLHTIFTGGSYDSHLVIPLNQSNSLIGGTVTSFESRLV
ncbi:MAG: CocE/NonD family hydrolase [Acidobacteriaceae bacterium]